MTFTDEMRAYLEEPRFPVLATSYPDGRIQQTVIWYVLDGDRIILNTEIGRVKDRNVRQNPKVSLCWEDGYRWLTIEGTVVELVDDQERALEDIFAIARRYHPAASDEEIDRRYANFRQVPRTTLVIEVDRVKAHNF